MHPRPDRVCVDDLEPGEGGAQLEACEHDFVQDVTTEADLVVGGFDCLEKPEVIFAKETLALQPIRNFLYDFPIEIFLDGNDSFSGLEGVNGK
jgi:hypothetical protein